MDADAKRVKAAIKTLGKKHVTLLREAFGDKHTVYWFTWERQMLGGRTPLQAIEAGETAKVREIIEFIYDLSTIPAEDPEENSETVELEEAENETEE